MVAIAMRDTHRDLAECAFDDVIWMEKLTTPASGSAVTPMSPTGPEGPQLPAVVTDTDHETGSATGDDS